MLDDLGPDGVNLGARHIRLSEEVPPGAPASRLPEVGVTDPLAEQGASNDETKKQRKRKKGKKARRQAHAEPDARAPGSTKKVKATKRLAAQLQGLVGALTQLRTRLSDLHSLQLDHAESTAALSRRVHDLDGLAAAERERGGRLEALQRGVDERLQGLDAGLGRMQAEVLRTGDTLRTWTQSRLARLARHQVWALGLIGLLGVGLIAVDWWRGDRFAAGITGRLEALEQRPAPLPLDAQDLLERLRRLESDLVQTVRDLAVARQQSEGGGERLAELAAGQRALVQGLDALRRDLAATDKGLAVLDERVRGLARVAQPAPASSEPVPLEGPGYAIQLVAYHSRARIGPFVEQHGIGGQARIAAIRAGGRQAYAVLLGPYVSAAEASQALGALPAALRDLTPWVRRLPSGTRLQPWP